jgi:3'-phosphoadenosine 5'-phosphosulfate sulfotransferase (PAPS reductase)/FAD synthetase
MSELLFEVPVEDKIAEAHGILDEAIGHAGASGKAVVATVILFSGGDDSTVLAHLFKDRATHAAHANTGIGIPQTRQFVRDTCAAWNLPLAEKHPRNGEGYRELVLGQCAARTGPNKGTVVWRGFPGPAGHWMMYQRLKERSLEQVRNELISNPRRERVIFLAGRRKEESGRRKARFGANEISAIERRGSVIWVSPLIGWTKLDLNAYRRLCPDVPRNEVAALLHMSGECLCGAYAQAGELDEIGFWFPDVAAEIRQLEAEALALGTIPPERCKWGWGLGRERPSRTGPMCSSCDARFEQLELFDDR